MQRPLVLLVAARRAERQTRPSSRSASDGVSVVRGRVPRRERRGQALVEPEHLRARAEAEAEPRDQPASSAASRRSASPRRCCRTGRRRRGARVAASVGSPIPPAPRSLPRRAVREPAVQPGAARPTPRRRRAARRSARTPARQQQVERDVDARVAVERLAVGERELRASMTVWTYSAAPRASRSSRRGGELLEEDRSLTPRPGLVDGQSA